METSIVADILRKFVYQSITKRAYSLILSILQILILTMSPAHYPHIAPLGLRIGEDTCCYTHIAPPGLKIEKNMLLDTGRSGRVIMHVAFGRVRRKIALLQT